LNEQLGMLSFYKLFVYLIHLQTYSRYYKNVKKWIGSLPKPLLDWESKVYLSAVNDSEECLDERKIGARLQEIIRSPSCDVRFASSWGRIELKEAVLQCIIQFHNGRLIATSVTVIWSGENCNNISIV